MAGGADHLLLDTVRRRLRQPAGWVIVVLHLSRLAPPAPRPHHRRIARVLLEDAARRYEGQVFALPHGDLLLLCRAGEDRRSGAPQRVASPQALPEVLARLFRADVPDAHDLVSFWPLDTAAETAFAYVKDGLAIRATAAGPAVDRTHQPHAVDALASALDGPDVAGLLRRHTAVLLAEDGMKKLFREIRFSLPALEARVAVTARTDNDPYLFRHLAERLDHRLLRLVAGAVGTGTALDPTVFGAPRLHLNLTLASVRADAFSRLANLLLGRGVALGIEVALAEACGDPERFEQARTVLHRLGITLVLDGVSHLALRLAKVDALRPDLIKLAWSPRMAEPDHAALGLERRLIQEFGAERIVLHHAETEAALRWGVERGIRRFQGRHVDAMLGALRLSTCRSADGCTLQQCIQRAAATDPGGRRGCRDHRLLDAGGPDGADRPTLGQVETPARAGPSPVIA